MSTENLPMDKTKEPVLNNTPEAPQKMIPEGFKGFGLVPVPLVQVKIEPRDPSPEPVAEEPELDTPMDTSESAPSQDPQDPPADSTPEPLNNGECSPKLNDITPEIEKMNLDSNPQPEPPVNQPVEDSEKSSETEKPETPPDLCSNSNNLEADAKKSVYDCLRDTDFSQLTQEGLEELIGLKIAEWFQFKTPLAQLRKQTEELHAKCEKYDALVNAYKRQLVDLKHIIKKLYEEKKKMNLQDGELTPVHVMRSVGLQVRGSVTRSSTDIVRYARHRPDGINTLQSPLLLATVRTNTTECRITTPAPTTESQPILARVLSNAQKTPEPAVTIALAKKSTSNAVRPPIPVNVVIGQRSQATNNSLGDQTIPRQGQPNNVSNGTEEVIDLTDAPQSKRPKTCSSTGSVITKPSKPPETATTSEIIVLDDFEDVDEVQFVSETAPPVTYPALPEFPPGSRDALRPPKPLITIDKNHIGGVILTWRFPRDITLKTRIERYEFYYYDEDGQRTWSCIGSINGLKLPMACSLNKFPHENRYYFIVRAIDIKGRIGDFSSPISTKDIIVK